MSTCTLESGTTALYNRGPGSQHRRERLPVGCCQAFGGPEPGCVPLRYNNHDETSHFRLTAGNEIAYILASWTAWRDHYSYRESAWQPGRQLGVGLTIEKGVSYASKEAYRHGSHAYRGTARGTESLRAVANCRHDLWIGARCYGGGRSRRQDPHARRGHRHREGNHNE